MLWRHASSAEIARTLGKHRSTITREVKRNTNAAGIYYEVHAQSALLRRQKKAKARYRIIDNDPWLETTIEELLKIPSRQSRSPDTCGGLGISAPCAAKRYTIGCIVVGRAARRTCASRASRAFHTVLERSSGSLTNGISANVRPSS